MSEWVKCSERLPDSKQWVLCHENGHSRVCLFVQGYFMGPIDGQPTHWMPLPVPPVN